MPQYHLLGAAQISLPVKASSEPSLCDCVTGPFPVGPSCVDVVYKWAVDRLPATTDECVKMQLAKQQMTAKQRPTARNDRHRVTHLLLFTPLSVKDCCAVLEWGGCPFVTGAAGGMLCWGRKCKAGATKGGALMACFLGSCSSFLHGTTTWVNVRSPNNVCRRLLTERDSRPAAVVLVVWHTTAAACSKQACRSCV